MNNKKTYFITGGGTGGHIYPASAVADELLKSDDTENLYYVGNPANLEYTIAMAKGYEFLPVKSSGMPRNAGFGFLKWTVQMLFATIKCCFYISKYKPDTIFGTGGYVSAPVLAAGVIMKVPFVMHDCDANPGLVTRKFAPFAKSVSVAFDEAKNKLNAKVCHVNGNPVRTEFSTLTKETARKRCCLNDKLTLCIMGGSQGAKTINDAAVQVLKQLSQEYNLQIIFQTGKKNYETVVNRLRDVYPEFETDKNLLVRPYFDNMAEILKSSDIAVSRAGSLSISEICASAIAPVFVPYPYAAADHQRKNAQNIVSRGAGFCVEDKDLSGSKLMGLLKPLIVDSEYLHCIQQKSFALAKFDGLQNIIKQITG